MWQEQKTLGIGILVNQDFVYKLVYVDFIPMAF